MNHKLPIAQRWDPSRILPQLKLAIEEVLDTLPEAYNRPLYAQKCSALFEHVYESYQEKGVNIFTTTA